MFDERPRGGRPRRLRRLLRKWDDEVLTLVAAGGGVVADGADALGGVAGVGGAGRSGAGRGGVTAGGNAQLSLLTMIS